MRKLLLVLLLCPVMAYATDPISARRDSLRAKVYDKLNLPSTGTNKIDTSVANSEINNAIARICDDFDAYEQMDTLVASSDSEGVALPSDFLRIRQVFRMKGTEGWKDAQRTPLTPIAVGGPIWTLTANLSDAIKQSGKRTPPPYFYVASGRLMFHPRYSAPSSTSDSFLVLYWAQAPGLYQDTAQAVIDKQFREAVVWLAAAELAALRHDYDIVNRFMTLYGKLESLYGVRQPEKAQETEK